MAEQLKALSLSERERLVRSAVYDAIGTYNALVGEYHDDLWVCEVYDGYCIIEDWGIQGYWRAEYAIDESQNVTLQIRASWVRVEKEWSPMKSLVTFSPGLKATGDGKFEGFLRMGIRSAFTTITAMTPC